MPKSLFSGLRRSTYTIPRAALIGGVVVLVLAAGAAGNWIGYKRMLTQTQTIINSIHPTRENNFNYKFIYPLLGYNFGQAQPFFEDHALEKQVNDYIQSAYKAGSADGISVYWRSFPTANWAGVNQGDKYHPGSILKVLIMIGYYREAELDPTILKKTYYYSAEANQEAHGVEFAMPTTLAVGRSYTVQQLMEAMIANSDNGAETLLINNIDRKILNDAYTDLGIPNPDSVTGDYTISPQQYTGFLRILYNSTYLIEKYSEAALMTMSHSTYKEGIDAGLPSSIISAQKYGERVNGTPGDIQTIELHDCGIVYAEKPYALCIMTKGDDLDKLTHAIKDISSIVYGYASTH